MAILRDREHMRYVSFLKLHKAPYKAGWRNGIIHPLRERTKIGEYILFGLASRSLHKENINHMISYCELFLNMMQSCSFFQELEILRH